MVRYVSAGSFMLMAACMGSNHSGGSKRTSSSSKASSSGVKIGRFMRRKSCAPQSGQSAHKMSSSSLTASAVVRPVADFGGAPQNFVSGLSRRGERHLERTHERQRSFALIDEHER